MPKKLISKVRSIFSKSTPETPAPTPEKATSSSAKPAQDSVKSAPSAKAGVKEEKVHVGAPAPAPVRKVQEARAPKQEEWRPGKGNGGNGSGDKGSGEGERSRSGNSNRRRRNGNRNGNRSGNREGTRNGENRRSGDNSENRSKDGSGQGGRREGGDRQGGNRNRNRKSNSNRSGKKGTTRGKGFSFPRPKPDAGDWTREQYQVEPEEGKVRFLDLDLEDALIHAIADLKYKFATPIQGGILPDLIKGRDGLGQAQTGTGKTAAFLLSGLNRMLREPKPDLPNGAPRILVLAPTRELVLQIEEEAAQLIKYTPFQSLPVYGGLDYEPQKEALQNHKVELVSATPGRLIDFLRSKVIDLSHVEILVLDEADRMLDMGFIPDVKRIVYSTPHKDKRQTLFFSATFTDDIKRLASSWTRDPVSVVIEPESVAADTVDQTVYIVTDKEKFALTVNMLRNLKPERTLIFANRRDTSQDLCDHLQAYGFKVALLSGAVPQAKRVKTLEAFKDGSTPVVVATDVAGRGIHVDDVGLVINYNLPEDPEDYVHRIGRTGRAGEEGKSICFASEFDSMMLPDIETYIGRELVCTHPEPEWLEVEEREIPKRQRRPSNGGGGRGGRSGGGRGRPGGNRGRQGGNRGRSGGGGGRRS